MSAREEDLAARDEVRLQEEDRPFGGSVGIGTCTVSDFESGMVPRGMPVTPVRPIWIVAESSGRKSTPGAAATLRKAFAPGSPVTVIEQVAP